ncbi:hypothetical protein GCM10027612_43000 [Microbispora bryophytorum subsp. camponoti]
MKVVQAITISAGSGNRGTAGPEAGVLLIAGGSSGRVLPDAVPRREGAWAESDTSISCGTDASGTLT